ncbi:hypothetical protein IHV25_00030 [Phaeovibrio sulfidiphilus]|uniref:Uncharacterized protein n=1 Tax=Phaeovibrio sulfidiphilus TaxID=1220600 RepID=A0A8J7CNL9_9PROT|nr:hypothetical protein [Phaeovibrio sulfidiphilus]MBE1236047.1 hypothetical protein [Phaeovibrio sulfidiphilus]
MANHRFGLSCLGGMALAAGLLLWPGAVGARSASPVAPPGAPSKGAVNGPRALADGEVVRIDTSPPEPCRVDLGPLSLVASPAADGGSFDATLYDAGRKVDASATGFVFLGAGRPVADVPLPGCQSRRVELFSGGANCCSTYYLLGSCPSGPFAVYVDSGSKSFMEDAVGLGADGSVRAFPVTDPVFQSYGPDLPGATNWVSFSTADSPAVSRFMVFENGAWRMDRVGEFPQAYDDLIAKIPAQHSVSPASAAVARAYYTAMKGEPALPVLEAALPPDWQPFRAVINADILRAVGGFNPIHTIRLEDAP